MAQFQFNAASVEPDSGKLDPVPAGWYEMMVKTSEMVETKDKQGKMLKVQAEIISGQYKGRKVYVNFNVENKSDQAVDIGLKQLSALCHAVGVLGMQDTAQLHAIPFKGKLKLIPAIGQYDAKNEFAAYRHINDATAGAPVGAVAPAASAAVTPPPPPRPAIPASVHSPVPLVNNPPPQQFQPVQQAWAQPVQQPAPVAQAPQPPQADWANAVPPAQAQQPAHHQQAPVTPQPDVPAAPPPWMA